jgi:stage V sporulation protein SpoVS
MDQLMVDSTELPDGIQGDIATLIGKDGSAEITAEQVAANAGTIANEVLRRGWVAAWKGFLLQLRSDSATKNVNNQDSTLGSISLLCNAVYSAWSTRRTIKWFREFME